ncbi:MAG: hypothetical protein WCC64_07915 [Aliidongia sp.]
MAQTAQKLAERNVDVERTIYSAGTDLLNEIRDNPALADLPVAVFTGRELSPEEDGQLPPHRAQRGREGRGIAGAAAR